MNKLVDKIYAATINDTLRDFLGFSNPDAAANAELSQIQVFIKNITDLALDVGGIVAFIMILYAATIYLTSYGDESKAEMAKKTLIWSVIGLAVIALSKSILFIIYNNLLVK